MDLSYMTHSFDSQSFLSTLALFIHRLAYYQHRQFKTAPNKAKTRLRLVAGLNQIMSHFKSPSQSLSKPIKMLIAATDLTDDFLIQRDWLECLQMAQDKLIPVFYGFPRKQLASLLSGRKELSLPNNDTLKNNGTSVTIIAILSTDGAHQEYTFLIDEHEKLSNLWKEQLIMALKSNINMHLLWHVAAYGHFSILKETTSSFPKILIQEMINYIDPSSGMTMLHISSARGHAKIASYLIGLEFDLKEKDFALRTALHYAALYGHDEMVREFISRQPDSCFIKDANGMEPLVLSASVGHGDCVRLLIENATKEMIERALEQAAFLKNPSIAQILIEKLFEQKETENGILHESEKEDEKKDHCHQHQNQHQQDFIERKEDEKNQQESNHFSSLPSSNSSINCSSKRQLSINILINSVKSNSFNTLQKIISIFTHRINEPDSIGRTAIWWSAYLQHYDLYVLLKKHGGDTTAKALVEGSEYSAEDLYALRTT